MLLQPGGLRNESTTLGFPGKAPSGLPARSELWAAAMPPGTPGHRHCPAMLPGKPGDRDHVCLSLTLLPPEGTPGLGCTGDRTGQLSMVCNHSSPEGMEKALGCCWAALLTPNGGLPE